MPEKPDIDVIPLTNLYAKEKSDEILALEHNWTAIGDEAWKIENLMMDLPLKWELSNAALYKGKIIGYQIGSLKNQAAYLHKIIVDGKLRSLGIGKKLLIAFLNKCLEKNIERICFLARVDNVGAVKFYEKLGFKHNKEIDRSRENGIESYFYDNLIKEVLSKILNA